MHGAVSVGCKARRPVNCSIVVSPIFLLSQSGGMVTVAVDIKCPEDMQLSHTFVSSAKMETSSFLGTLDSSR